METQVRKREVRSEQYEQKSGIQRERRKLEMSMGLFYWGLWGKW